MTQAQWHHREFGRAFLVVSALWLAAASWPLIATKPSFSHQSDGE